MTVKMDKDPEEFYSDINSLLFEICTFLNNVCDNLSSSEKKQAQDLIEKSKKQLTVLTKIISENTEDYVVMTPEANISPPLLPKNSPKTAPLPIASNIKNSSNDYTNTENVSSPQIIENEQTNYPFKDLSAKDASNEIKCGTLIFHRKMFNIFGHSRKIYAAIHEGWLLLYWSTRHTKPFYALHLKQYDAQEDESDINELDIQRTDTFNLNPKKKKSSFKVFNTINKEKKYSFTANTYKDMLQWVFNIKKEHQTAIPTDTNTSSENKSANNDLTDDGENIYDDVIACRDPERLLKRQITKDERPALPAKPPHLKPLSQRSSSSSQNSEIYNELVIGTKPEKDDLSENEDYYELDQVIINKKDEKDEKTTPVKKAPPTILNIIDKKSKIPPPLPQLPNETTEEQIPTDQKNVYEEFYVTPTKAPPEKPKVTQNSNFMKITRRNTIKSEISTGNFETFSRNSKIETFQASPLKELPPTTFHSTSVELPTIRLDCQNNHSEESKLEVPMVLLKPTEDNESKPKKKKSPSISIQKRQKILFK